MLNAKRLHHLALFSSLSLEEFCAKFTAAFGLPKIDFDFENETEWGSVEFMDIGYNISRPFEKGVLQEWDSSVPIGCILALQFQ